MEKKDQIGSIEQITYNFDDIDDDDENENEVTIVLSHDIRINYIKLLEKSKVVKQKYSIRDIDILSKDLYQYQQKYNIEDKNVDSFLKCLIDNHVQVTTSNYFDYLKLTKFFKISKMEKILHNYFQNHIKDMTFIIKNLKDQLQSQNENDDIIDEITPEIENNLSEEINCCLQLPEFCELPIQLIHRLLSKNPKQINDDLLFNFINESLDKRFVLFQFLNIEKLSDTELNKLCEIFANKDDSEINHVYLSYLPSSISYIKLIINEKNEMKNLVILNEQLENEKRNLSAKNEQLIEEKKKLLMKNEQLENEKKELFEQNEQLKREKITQVDALHEQITTLKLQVDLKTKQIEVVKENILDKKVVKKECFDELINAVNSANGNRGVINGMLKLLDWLKKQE